MSYRVLIVDDEPGIAEGLKLLVERYVPECRVVGVAYDGNQGYEKVLKLQPDVVLTDIRMPEADGIEMIERLKKAGFRGHYIILSGYAEFEYAKSAIRLGVEEYITKPVEEEELMEVFLRACRSIQEEQEKLKKVERLEDDLDHYSRHMKGYILKDILTSSQAGGKEIREQLDKLTFPMSCKQYCCAVFEKEGGIVKKDRTALCCAMEEAAEHNLDFCDAKLVIPFSDKEATVILAYNGDKNYRNCLNALGRMRLAVSEAMEACVSAGVGQLYHKPDQLQKCFEEAACALNYKVLKGSGSVISYEEIRDMEGNSGLIDEEDVKELEACIDAMDDSGCRRVIEEIFYKIEREKKMGLEELQLLSLNLVLTGIRKMPFMQFQLNEYLGRNILSLESIARFQTIDQLKNFIINTLKSMNELMLKANMPEKRDVVEEAKIYIKKNFNKEISLNDISEQFFINPYYFSQLFKKKTGETYQSYLTGLRVSRARKLLEETNLKLYEVCSMVGYSDSNHFNKVFERIVGVKPGEYKKMLEMKKEL